MRMLDFFDRITKFIKDHLLALVIALALILSSISFTMSLKCRNDIVSIQETLASHLESTEVIFAEIANSLQKIDATLEMIDVRFSLVEKYASGARLQIYGDVSNTPTKNKNKTQNK